VSITAVTVSKDLAYAKVYVSSFEGEGHKKPGAAVNGLNHAAGYIQGVIGKRIRLRNTPRLTFIADHGIEDGFHINEKIKEVLS
jgi:ribosome-binding factor A